MRHLPVTSLKVAMAMTGAGLMAVMLYQVGWTAVVQGVARVGWALPVIVALGALRSAFRARAWTVCAAPAAPAAPGCSDPLGLPFAVAFRTELAADALGNLTPLGLLASEPAKILLVRSRLSLVTSMASVAVENVFYGISVLLVLLTGTVLFFQRAHVPPVVERAGEAIVVAALLAGAAGSWALRTRPAVLTAIAPVITRIAGKAHAPAETLREVESRMYAVVRWPLERAAQVGLCEALFHAAAVLEVWLILRLLTASGGATLADAFLMESAGRFVTVVFKFIPFRLGIDEAGSSVMAQVIGLNPAVGVTIALVRRLRIVVLNAVGLALLARP